MNKNTLNAIRNSGATAEDLQKVGEALSKIKFTDLAKANLKTTGK